MQNITIHFAADTLRLDDSSRLGTIRVVCSNKMTRPTLDRSACNEW